MRRSSELITGDPWDSLARSPAENSAITDPVLTPELRSFAVMIAIPPAVALLAYFGVTAWQHWLTAAAVALALLHAPLPRMPRWSRLRLPAPHIDIAEAGLRVSRPLRRERLFRWEEIEWISTHQPAALDLGTAGARVAVTIATTGGESLAVWLPSADTVAVSAFLWGLNDNQADRRMDEARKRLESGVELDFGAVRLNQTHIKVKDWSGWTELPLAPWRSAEDSGPPPMATFDLSGTVFHNPQLFYRLVRGSVPVGRIEIDRTSWGGIRRIQVAVVEGS